MRLIREIRDKDILGKESPSEEYKSRIAARAIISNDSGEIAVLSPKDPSVYPHKLPGGGLENEENIIETLKREVKEEVGADVDIMSELGKIIEYKNNYNQKQTSYCFLAKLKDRIGEPTFTEQEKSLGYELQWIPLKKAIELFQESTPEDYTAKFIRLRDLTFLQEAAKSAPLKIALGTTSEWKIKFVKQILGEIGISYELIPVKTHSKVSDQPLTEEETLTGSINRANHALNETSEADIGLGIEVGYNQNSRGDFEMFCYASITDRRTIVSSKSHSLHLPTFYQDVLKNKKEMHEYVGEYYKKDDHPTTQYLAKMIDEREPFIVEAARGAILKFFQR